MFPIKDSIKGRTIPIIIWTLIFVNSMLFFLEILIPIRTLEIFIYKNAVIPLKFSQSITGDYQLKIKDFLNFLTCMFLHGGWVHIIGNMWTLWIFGDNVEDKLGKVNFIIFYLLSGIFASIIHVITNPFSEIPIIGASGAIAGVMGAYFYFFPSAKILIMLPILFFPVFFEVPAIIFLGFWFFQQAFNGALSLANTEFAGGIAWWAHIGGFIFGYFYVKIFYKGDKKEDLS